MNMGNPKRSSRWICLRCMKENMVGDGLQRGGHQREKGHIKNLICLCTKLNDRTKNLEVRWCDSFNERMEYAKEIQKEFYDKNGNLLDKWRERIIIVER